MKRFSIMLIPLVAMVFLVTYAGAAEVVQGKCLAFDSQQQKVVIEEYDTNFSQAMPYGNPTGIRFEGSLENAKVGITPEPGDILRIAYQVAGETKQVLKVMNVSKQDLRKK